MSATHHPIRLSEIDDLVSRSERVSFLQDANANLKEDNRALEIENRRLLKGVAALELNGVDLAERVDALDDRVRELVDMLVREEVAHRLAAGSLADMRQQYDDLLNTAERQLDNEAFNALFCGCDFGNPKCSADGLCHSCEQNSEHDYTEVNR